MDGDIHIPRPGDLWLPQVGVLSDVFLPPEVELPEVDNQGLRSISFYFPAVGPLGTATQTIQIVPAFVVWAIVCASTTTDGFQFILRHTSKGVRRLMNKAIDSRIGAGTALDPLWLTETYLLKNSDQLYGQVKSLGLVNPQTVWVTLWGCDVVVKG